MRSVRAAFMGQATNENRDAVCRIAVGDSDHVTSSWCAIESHYGFSIETDATSERRHRPEKLCRMCSPPPDGLGGYRRRLRRRCRIRASPPLRVQQVSVAPSVHARNPHHRPIPRAQSLPERRGEARRGAPAAEGCLQRRHPAVVGLVVVAAKSLCVSDTRERAAVTSNVVWGAHHHHRRCASRMANSE